MTSAPLGPLTRLIAGDRALAAMLGTEDAFVPVSENIRAFILASVVDLGSAPVVLFATPTTGDSERLVHELRAFLDEDRVLVFPAWETLPFERVSPNTETMGLRMRTISRIRDQHLEVNSPSLCVVAPVKALLQRMATGDPAGSFRLAKGDPVGVEEIVSRAVRLGYRREYQVEHRGEIAVRGGIVDMYPSTGEIGVRIDCFGDEIDRLTEFDLADQRSVRDLEQVEIFACREFALTKSHRARAAQLAQSETYAQEQFSRIASGEIFDGIESFLPWLEDEEALLSDLLHARDRVVLIEPRRMRDRAIDIIAEEAALAKSLASTWGVERKEAEGGFPRLHVDFDRLLAKVDAPTVSMPTSAESPEAEGIRATTWPSVRGDGSVLARRMGELVRKEMPVVVCADGLGSAERLSVAFETEGLTVDRLFLGEKSPPESFRAQIRLPMVHVVVASLERGFIYELGGLGILAEADITGRHRPHRVPRPRARSVEGFFDDLAPGGYVVHHVHGVARFQGLVTQALTGVARDYLLLEYRGGDKLYVPSDQIDSITPYTGGDAPTLSRLNGSEWQRQRSRVRHAVREIAQELVVLYQRRLASDGHAFGLDTLWQHEMEQAFPFPETHDQLRAIAEIKQDMERPIPMDRLVCGDVGFGKTEVAVRAAFKAVQDNKQVVILVPTTLLAQQHFQTFSDRFSGYPVRVEMLSRFLTVQQARRVVAGLKDGSVDVVVGTHRILSEEIAFKDLGLLVIDEEQRFGVSHKERLKALKVGVDILTLTASPIPRTLEMGLTGIRDLSVIDTPPAERQPILTYVGEYDERAVAEAIRRELLREGQVFFVHNRVADIERVARALDELVPEARIAIAHGQMDEGTLEQVVFDFAQGAYDVLVCTTIIESGIDMPTVNTLVVDRADLLGLGQLHQLRGRVGRADQRAYAYLFHPVDRRLTEQAYERLKTIGEHNELGSGFKIAMRDLEIRGAGNLLGNDQSGHIAAVGYDLYVRMVAEAVAQLKGEQVPEPAAIKIELPVTAHIPQDYIAREDLRLEAYRRLSSATTEEEVDDIGVEWLDRYGFLPEPAVQLLVVARLRVLCLTAEIRELTVTPYRPGFGGPGEIGGSLARLAPVSLRSSQRVRLSRVAPKALLKEQVNELIVPFRRGAPVAEELLDLIGGLYREADSQVGIA
ncbi:MAG TPA: transcription-repair coupling factor [Acidimicrobiales bacterium]|nr:transcription-repair coupling factor [Acidimicrobiales bacterium]